MPTRRFARIAIVCILGAMVFSMLVALWGIWTQQKKSDFAGCFDSHIAGGDIGGAFTLVSETGATVTDRDVITHPSLVYFGYTFCPDVCPPDNARNAAVTDLLLQQGINVQPVFISVDGHRDTPAVMRDFTHFLHPSMLGLTGSDEQIANAAKAYRVYYNAHTTDNDDDFYLVDHSTLTYFVTPDNGVVSFFRRDLSPKAVAEQITCYLDT